MRAVRPRLLAGLLAMLASAVPVTVLALLVRRTADPVPRFDQWVDVQLTRFTLAHESVRRAGELGAYALHPWVFRALVLVAIVVLFRRRARAAALWAGATVVAGGLLGVGLKLAVHRARPVLDDPVATASGYSFPSGHALNSALCVSVLLVLLWRPLGRRGYRALAAVLAVLLVLATAMDRLLLGVHYPSDVVAGDLVGVLAVVSSWVAFGPVLRERARREADRAASAGAVTGSP